MFFRQVHPSSGRVVIGSADHAVKEICLKTGKTVRNLYTQRAGHTDWVTCVEWCEGGRILSGGADGKVGRGILSGGFVFVHDMYEFYSPIFFRKKQQLPHPQLFLWPSSGVAGFPLVGHTGSVSNVKGLSSKLGVSSSYDKTLRIWDLAKKDSLQTLCGHSAPILTFVTSGDHLISGDRSGLLKLWDLSTASPLATMTGHKGHITALFANEDKNNGPSPSNALTVSGAQDGHVRLWDVRTKKNTANFPLHVGGAVNELWKQDDLLISML